MKTKIQICVVICLLFAINSRAQIGNKSIPYSWENGHEINLKDTPRYIVTKLDNKKLLEEDEKFHRENADQPFTFGKPITVNMEIQEKMTWTVSFAKK